MTTGSDRKAIHVRKLECTGYLRSDGRYDIEGQLIDTKPYRYALVHRVLQPGEPLHHMKLVLTAGRDGEIHGAAAETLAAPYSGECHGILPAYAQLIGMRIQPGFVREVRRMFAGIEGCSHITELIPMIATTFFQIVWSAARSEEDGANPADARSISPLNGCHALRSGGPVVTTYFNPPERSG